MSAWVGLPMLWGMAMTNVAMYVYPQAKRLIFWYGILATGVAGLLGWGAGTVAGAQ